MAAAVQVFVFLFLTFVVERMEGTNQSQSTALPQRKSSRKDEFNERDAFRFSSYKRKLFSSDFTSPDNIRSKVNGKQGTIKDEEWNQRKTTKKEEEEEIRLDFYFL